MSMTILYTGMLLTLPNSLTRMPTITSYSWRLETTISISIHNIMYVVFHTLPARAKARKDSVRMSIPHANARIFARRVIHLLEMEVPVPRLIIFRMLPLVSMEPTVSSSHRLM